jgi:hypothetical protein
MPIKTPFSTKCEILSLLWTVYKDTDNENWADFFRWSDVGLPLAYMISQDLATAKAEGKEIVNETWSIFCEMISIDPDEKYTDLASVMAASPNKEVE